MQVDSVISQLYPDAWFATKAGHWSRYQIATTVRHENESTSSSIYLAAHPSEDPEVSDPHADLSLAEPVLSVSVVIDCF